MRTHTGPTSHWVEDSSMRIHTGPTARWVEDGGTLDQQHTGLRIALWGHTGPTSHWIEDSSMGTPWTNSTLG